MKLSGFRHLFCLTALQLALLLQPLWSQQAAPAVALRCEFMTEPQGIDRPEPRLSWNMQAIKGADYKFESAWRVLAASSEALLATDTGDLWDSGKRHDERRVAVPYEGQTLKSFQNCFWKVKIWDEKGVEQPWSTTARWGMGLLNQEEWQAQWLQYTAENEPSLFEPRWYDEAFWIWHPDDGNDQPQDVVRFFKTTLSITETRELRQARILLCACDAFQLFVNGQPLSDVHPYEPEGAAPEFDLLPALKNGDNVIQIKAFREASFPPAGVIAVIKILNQKDSVETHISSESWLASLTSMGPWLPARRRAPASYAWYRTPGWRQKAPSPIFRREFNLDKSIASAKIAISGLGYCELYCNGRRVGDHRLDPAFTNYDKRVLYTCYDLTDCLQPGANVLGVMLGSGWYNMHTRATWNFDRAPWRDEPKMMAQLLITFTDGTEQTIVSDASWRASTGPVVHDGIRSGEVYDARLEQPGWDRPGFDDSSWHRPRIAAAPDGMMDSQTMPPVRVVRTVAPAAITEAAPGVFVADMGVNMAGWARLHIKADAGTVIRLRYSERLNENGMIDQHRNARYVFQGPFQTDTYICNDGDVQIWEPRFTYHGFRYVEVTGLPGRLTAGLIEGRVVNTDFEHIGHFECSNDLLNQIFVLTGRSYQSNFVGYPTDCPQREKNGWTGDAQLASEMGMLSFDNLAAYNKWAYDLTDALTPQGDLPGIVPTAGWGHHKDNGPGWGSAAVIIPWNMYLYSGDTGVLEDHYELARTYVNFLNSTFPNHIVEMGRGDWCFLNTRTPGRVTSTALYYHNIQVLETMAEVLSKKDDAAHYRALAVQVKEAYHKAFYRGDGRYDLGSQTAQAVSLFYGLVPDSERPLAVARLVQAVHEAHDHLDVGILGAKALFRTLTNNGQHELAYKIVTQPDFPGYADRIARGFTTLWEDWTDTEGSMNHVMFGDIVTWFYRDLAGINPVADKPGFRHILIRPRPAGDLSYVRASTRSFFGEIKSEWQKHNGRFMLDISIPPGSSATVVMPGGQVHEVGSGEYEFETAIDG